MPHVSDRGLRYVLRRIANGSRVTAASYLADRCLGDGSARDLLETEAESLERAELERVRLSEDASRRAVEARRADKEERDSLKGNIIDRYADEVRICENVEQAVTEVLEKHVVINAGGARA